MFRVEYALKLPCKTASKVVEIFLLREFTLTD